MCVWKIFSAQLLCLVCCEWGQFSRALPPPHQLIIPFRYKYSRLITPSPSYRPPSNQSHSMSDRGLFKEVLLLSSFHSPFQSPSNSPFHSPSHSPFHSPSHLPFHSRLTHPLTHPLTHSITHPSIQPLTHSSFIPIRTHLISLISLTHVGFTATLHELKHYPRPQSAILSLYR